MPGYSWKDAAKICDKWLLSRKDSIANEDLPVVILHPLRPVNVNKQPDWSNKAGHKLEPSSSCGSSYINPPPSWWGIDETGDERHQLAHRSARESLPRDRAMAPLRRDKTTKTRDLQIAVVAKHLSELMTKRFLARPGVVITRLIQTMKHRLLLRPPYLRPIQALRKYPSSSAEMTAATTPALQAAVRIHFHIGQRQPRLQRQ